MKPVNFQIIKRILFNYLKVFIAVSLTFFLSSCTTVTDSLYVQDVNVKGPINQPPIRIAGRDSTTFIISPKFFINSNRIYNGRIDGHTQVNSEGIFQVDTIINGNEITYKIAQGKNTFDYKGENLHWSIPDYMVGLDLDIALSKKSCPLRRFHFLREGQNKSIWIQSWTRFLFSIKKYRGSIRWWLDLAEIYL